jgi:hypothetical protein
MRLAYLASDDRTTREYSGLFGEPAEVVEVDGSISCRESDCIENGLDAAIHAGIATVRQTVRPNSLPNSGNLAPCSNFLAAKIAELITVKVYQRNAVSRIKELKF